MSYNQKTMPPQTMTKKRSLIVDDEPAARRKLRRLLAEHKNIEIVGEADDGLNAIQCIETLHPDIVFLDIQIPELDGLQVAMATRHIPYQLIFVTAFDQYAISAFETHAIDYLLKPIKQQRLTQSLKKIDHLHAVVRPEQLQQMQYELYPDTLQSQIQTQIAIRRGAATLIVDSGQIGYLDTITGYCRVHLNALGQAQQKTDTLISDATLEFMLQQLPQTEFLRIHRSYVVNRQQITSYLTEQRRVYITLRDFAGQRLPVSRANVGQVKQYWRTL